MALQYLECEDYVLHTYAAIAIDRILAMKEEDSPAQYKYGKPLLLERIEKILGTLFTVLKMGS